MRNTKTRKIAIAGVLLAICIVSQFFKNLSVYITGPIINTCIIVAALSCGPLYGLLLSIVTPITAFFITGNPLMSAIPLIIPCIMIGNSLLSAISAVAYKYIKNKYVAVFVGGIVGSLVKALFMAGTISYGLIPSFLPEAMLPKMPVFQATFSVTQFVAGCIGVAYALILWPVVKRNMSDVEV